MHKYCVTGTVRVTVTTGGKTFHKVGLENIALLQDSTFLELGTCSLRSLGRKRKGK
ncbi:hypothetical protein B7P43_G13936 [Cryptotermes secundus]|uniref:Uncharacterized protein n=1 Tax=Cryptotermes secundus TaxID=105785 RepID=A0A2J7Q8E0_9NEOP|nr:hypothetical protein B7P43_G13936 [Cryptotermes secundus]